MLISGWRGSHGGNILPGWPACILGVHAAPLHPQKIHPNSRVCNMDKQVPVGKRRVLVETLAVLLNPTWSCTKLLPSSLTHPGLLGCEEVTNDIFKW